jgi:hypothetical protein
MANVGHSQRRIHRQPHPYSTTVFQKVNGRLVRPTSTKAHGFSMRLFFIPKNLY